MADEDDALGERNNIAESGKSSFYKKMLRKNSKFKTNRDDTISSDKLEERLRVAARDGKISEVRRLLRLGAEIKPDQYGCSPVHHASLTFWSMKSSVEIISLLCEYGGSVNARDNLGQTALHRCVSNPLKRGLFDLQTDCSSVQMIKKLTSLGADINAVDISGQTALHVASMCRNFRCSYALEELRLLIMSGCNMDLQDRRGNTALHLLAAMGQYDKCKVLIQSGCNADLQNSQGNTALHLSGMCTDSKLVSLLVGAGVSVNLVNTNNQSALQYVLLKHFETVPLGAIEKLIRAGTDLYHQCDSGLSVFDIAAKLSKHKKGRLTIKLLTANFTQPKTLQEICRIVVRRFLKKPISYQRLQELFIPRQVASFLLLE